MTSGYCPPGTFELPAADGRNYCHPIIMPQAQLDPAILNRPRRAQPVGIVDPLGNLVCAIEGEDEETGSETASSPPMPPIDPNALKNRAERLGRDVVRKVIGATNVEELEILLKQTGVQFRKVESAYAGDPKYVFSGYNSPVELRVHVGADGKTIESYRFGIEAYHPQSPTNPVRGGPEWQPSDIDAPILRQIDKRIVDTFGPDLTNGDLRPEQWNTQYIDQLGFIYIGRDGYLVGLRTEAGHIRPIAP